MRYTVKFKTGKLPQKKAGTFDTMEKANEAIEGYIRTLCETIVSINTPFASELISYPMNRVVYEGKITINYVWECKTSHITFEIEKEN